MKRRLFSVGRTQVTMHLATPLFALYMALTGHGQLLAAGMLSIVLHEAGHALCAACCGHPPEEMELTPLGCLLRLDDEAALPPVKQLLTVAAGPAATLLLCWLSIRFTAAGWLTRSVGHIMYTANAALLIVNLLPALPLDGGRLLALALRLVLPQQAVRRVMRITGTVLGAALIACNAWLCLRFGGWNLSLMCAGCFVMYASAAASVTAAMQQLQQLMDRKIRMETHGILPAATLAVMTSVPLRLAVARLHPTRYTQLLLLEPGTMRLVTRVSEGDLVAAYLASPGENCRVLVQSGDRSPLLK